MTERDGEYDTALDERLTAIEALLTDALDKASDLRVWVNESVTASKYTARLPWFESERLRCNISDSLRRIGYIREDFLGHIGGGRRS